MRYLSVTMFSQHFWLLRALRQFTLSSVVPHLSDVLRRSRRALSAIIVRSWCAHLGKSCAHTALTSRSKIRNFLLKKTMRSQCAHGAPRARFFPIWAHVFPIWARPEREVSAIWAPKMRSPLLGVFERDVSATWARRERDMSATWARRECKNCLALFFHFAVFPHFMNCYKLKTKIWYKQK